MEPRGAADQFMYRNEQAMADVEAATATADFPTIEWQASEFIDHQKSAGWFFLLAGGAVVASGLMYLVTRSFFSSAVVLLALLAFGVVAHQKPRTLRYALQSDSLLIDAKHYSYDDFRSFSVNQEGGLPSISLLPNKRFVPILTVYFPPEDGEKIFDALAAHLPHEPRQGDAVDRLMKKIRF